MEKKSFANRFGLIALMMLSLFASTAFAGNTPAPTQVVVTNTPAQALPVTLQGPQYYQATQSVDCSGTNHANFLFNVPSGKTLLVRNVNVFMGSFDPSDRFGVYMYPDNTSSSLLFFAMQPAFSYGFGNSSATNQQVQMLATQTIQGAVSRVTSVTSCTAFVTISGELQ